MKPRKQLTEADIRSLVALQRGAVRQTPEGLRCLPVVPSPDERACVLAEHAARLRPGVRYG